MLDLTKFELMNAAGWCKTLEGVEKLCKTPVSQITVGSITLEPRELPEGNTFWSDEHGSVNSRNLQNMGLDKFLVVLPQIARAVRAAGKKLRVNVAGYSPKEYVTIVIAVLPYVDVVELNFGCPNIWGESGQKPIVSFDIGLMDNILNRILAAMPGSVKARITVKLSPFSDPMQLARSIPVFKNYISLVPEYVTSNTFPNGFALNGLSPAIAPGGGFGGVSGSAMRLIALGQGYKLQRELQPYGGEVTIVGGISQGRHIVDVMRCGIMRAQVGTHWMNNGDGVFSAILAEALECPGVYAS